MEIRPILEKKLPRYAAMITAVAAAGTLSACRTAGEVATSEPDPTEEVQLAGEEAVIESSEDELVVDGEMVVDSSNTVCVESSDEMVTLEGDVAAAPDFMDGQDAAAKQGRALEEVFRDTFAQKEITLVTYDDYYGYSNIPLIFKSDDETQPALHFGFFYGDDEAGGWKQRDYIRETEVAGRQTEYDWGFRMTGIVNDDETVRDYYVLIDLSRYPELSAEQVAAIAEEVLQ